MTFIGTVSEGDAEGDVAAIYDLDRGVDGTVPNYTKAFSARPGVYRAWKQLNAAVTEGMDPRRYELVSVAAARRLRSSYCTIAHAARLLDGGHMDGDAVQAVVEDHATAGLDPVDVAIMDLADKVAADAASVTQDDVDRLRALGLTDPEIFDVVAAAAMRSFFAKTLDGLGALPDARFGELEPELRATLTVGRPIDG